MAQKREIEGGEPCKGQAQQDQGTRAILVGLAQYAKLGLCGVAPRMHVQGNGTLDATRNEGGQGNGVRVVLGSADVCSERELLEHCRGRLASYKVPVRIEFVEALPQTASGKVLHRELR